MTLKSGLSCVLHPATPPPDDRRRLSAHIVPVVLLHCCRPAHAYYVNTLGCFTAVIKEYPLANHYQTIQVPCVDLKINLISLYFALRAYIYISTCTLQYICIYNSYCARAVEGRGTRVLYVI